MQNINTEFAQMMAFHIQAYPQMQPIDYLKLLYQNSFGCAHLIHDPNAALAYLRKEWQNTPYQEGRAITEPIGFGWVRVNLAAVQYTDKAEQELFQAFETSTKIDTSANAARFFQEVSLLRKAVAQEEYPLESKALLQTLQFYRVDPQLPLPSPFSHSDVYRQLYHPAYRVIHVSFCPFI